MQSSEETNFYFILVFNDLVEAGDVCPQTLSTTTLAFYLIFQNLQIYFFYKIIT